jgi:hypothetical protein
MMYHLPCPACGCAYLHHEEIKVFARQEDAPVVTETTVSDRGCTVMETDGAANPSERRGGIAIQFRCEECDDRPILKIAQHKGSSLVSFDVQGIAKLRVIEGGLR